MGKYKAVPAAEAYERDGENRPVCECHGELKNWQASDECKLGGRYRCSTKTREERARYVQSDRGREVIALYRRSDKGREIHNRCNANLYQSLKEDGWCVKCGEGVMAVSETLCQGCLDELSHYSAERYQNLKKAGWCTSCGEGTMAISEALCWDCLDKLAHRGRCRIRVGQS